MKVPFFKPVFKSGLARKTAKQVVDSMKANRTVKSKLGFKKRHVAKSRPLTAAEVAMARSVFGRGFDTNNIRIKSAGWVLKNYAVSPNGNIYFHPDDWVEDFGEQSLARRAWLIHELTHVWQLQQGLKVVRGALINRRYDYVLAEGKSFFKYGIEQQARMVEDYYMRRERGLDCQAWEVCIPFLRA